MTVGPTLVGTLRHFFPDFDAWLAELPEHRRPDRLTYQGRFLLWVLVLGR